MPRPFPKYALLLVPLLCLGLVACSSEPETDILDTPGDPGWPEGLVPPLPGATFSLSGDHLPGAGRDYRPGAHRGFDFFNGHSGRLLAPEEPAVAVAAGEIIRIDQDYDAPAAERLEYWASLAEAPGDVGRFALDQLRGRQVWIRHEGGHVSRYAHLSAVNPELVPGDKVEQGQAIGLIGNSGLAPTEDQPEPAAHLHFELWSPDGSRYLGQDLEPIETHHALANIFGPESLPRFAREAVEAHANGNEVAQPYPPEDLPETGFTVTPPAEVVAGTPFAAPITWEGDDFRPQDFFALLEGSPLGIIDSGDGAWILGAIPFEFEGERLNLTVGGVNRYGEPLVGERAIEAAAPAQSFAPFEVKPGALEPYSAENLRRESQFLANAIFPSLTVHQPRWDSSFQPPMAGNAVARFGQRLVTGPMAPAHPLPGILIEPDGEKTVVASNSGRVALIDDLPLRGKTVVIDHGGGVISIYSHMDSVTVDQAAQVEKGQSIGTVGPHPLTDSALLQWEIHVAGIASDPASWIGKLLPERAAAES